MPLPSPLPCVLVLGCQTFGERLLRGCGEILSPFPHGRAQKEHAIYTSANEPSPDTGAAGSLNLAFSVPKAVRNILLLFKIYLADGISFW